jgi:ABC-type lipoprotein export system ATPase subunit
VNTVSLIETRGLTKVYSAGEIHVAALKDIRLDLAEGGFFGITGASGSGKSTLLNCIGGLDRPTSGHIFVAGREISKLKKEELALYRRYSVGMIFQSFHILSGYSAVENVALPLLFAGIPRNDRLERAEKFLDLVGLSARRHHRPNELSGGEQQRVAIARALVNQPKVLLADEPTGNLDSRTSREIVGLLAELNRTQNLTVMMVSHEEGLLSDFASEIVRLRDGEIYEHIIK